MNIKCIMLDIDGTLTNSKGQISNYTKKIITKLVNKDIKVILASGRNIDSVIKISKACNASQIVIADNGSSIYDYLKNEFLFFKNINNEFINIIWDLCSIYNIDSIYNSLNLRYRNYKNLDKSYNEENDIIVERIEDIKRDVYQIVLLGFDDEKFNKCINKVNDNGLKVGNTAKKSNGIMFADINLKDISKGNAIKVLSDLLNLNKNNIMCFGDSMNDIEMFKNCGVKVAMKNAIDELKKYADYETRFSNYEDGVAKFLVEYFNL